MTRDEKKPVKQVIKHLWFATVFILGLEIWWDMIKSSYEAKNAIEVTALGFAGVLLSLLIVFHTGCLINAALELFNNDDDMTPGSPGATV